MRHHTPTTTRFVALAACVGSLLGATRVLAQDPTSITLNTTDPCAKVSVLNLSAPAPAAGVTVQLTSSVPASATVPTSLTVREGRASAEFQIKCVPSTQAVAVTLTAQVSGHPSVATTVLNIPAPVLSQITVGTHTGGDSVKAKVKLVTAAGPGGIVVTLSSPSTKVVVPAFVTVPDRSDFADFTIATRVVPQPSVVSIVATGLGVTKTVDLALQPPHPISMGFNTKPAPTTLLPTKTVEGTGGGRIRVYFNNRAPCCSNFAVALTSSHAALVTMPASIVFDGDSTFTEFDVTAKPVSQTTSVTLTATAGGASQSCVLVITPPELKSFSMTPSKVIGNQNSQGKLFYFTPAPPGGINVMLSTNNPALVGVPKQLTVPAGAQELVFPIETNGLEQPATVNVTVDAAGQKKTTQLELVPEGPTGIALVTNPMIGGTSAKAFVDAVLSTDAFVVQLSSSNPALATVPASVSFTGGVTRREFMVTTLPVAQNSQVTISAITTSATKSTGTFSGIQSTNYSVTRTVNLQVLAPVLTNFTLAVGALVGGTHTTGTVTISGKAPTGGVSVSISSDQGHAFPSAPVVIPAGATSVTFTLNTTSVSADTPLHITATIGNMQRAVDLLLKKP